MKKFMVDCRFRFEAYAKNVRENVTKVLLKIGEFLLDADGHMLN